MKKLDLKKELKPLYMAKSTPHLLNVPALNFVMIDGVGNPNTAPAYHDALQALYSVAYTMKFKVKKEQAIDYPVMALEGLWWMDDMTEFSIERKDDWKWTMMISVPDFITAEMIEAAQAEAALKKDLPALNKLRFEKFHEGRAAQIMHIGPYADEAPTIQRLHDFIHVQGWTFDGTRQKHHEIYLSDPRRAAPEKMKTIIRQPVK
jgi:hypothetical protein